MAEPLTKRPVLQLPRTSLEIAVEAIAFAGLLFVAWLLLQNWFSLPKMVPRHFNAAGQADAWGCRGTLLTMPAVTFVLYIGLSVVSQYPHICNYPFALTAENVERQYRYVRMLLAVVKAEVVWLFAYITYGIIQTATGQAAGLGMAFLPIIVIGTAIPLVVYLWLAWRAR